MTLKSTMEKVKFNDLKIKELLASKNELLPERQKIDDALKDIEKNLNSFLEENKALKNEAKTWIDRIKNNINQFLAASKLTCSVLEDFTQVSITENKGNGVLSEICVLDIDDGKLMVNVDCGIILPENRDGQVFFFAALSRILSINI